MIPAKLHRSFWLLCLLPFLLPAAASGQTLTVDDLAQKLDETCEKAPEKIPIEPSGSDWWSTKCEKQGSQPVDVAVCRSELLKLWRPKLEASQEEVIEDLKTSGNTLRSMKIEPASLATDLSRHLRLLRAEVEGTLRQEIAALDLSTFEPGDKPQESGKAAWKKIAIDLRRAAKRACELAASDTVDDAEILLTQARMATEARVKTAAALKSAEQEHFEELSGKKQNGFAQVVDCKWTPGDDVNPPTLVCSSGVLLSGEEPSVIRITGLDPKREFTVTARSAEEVVPAAPQLTGMGIAPMVRETLCPEEVGTTPKRRLSCDQLSVEGRDAAFVALHLPRYIKPSFGGNIRSLRYAAEVLRRPDRADKLSLVLFGRTPVIQVEVNDGTRTASSFLPSAYQRWTFETGGFFAVSNVVDHELVTRPVDGNATKVEVVRLANEDDQAQETGIFLNFVPRNYQVVGIGLGFSVESDRAPTTYIGPALRLRSFGERGLAALWGGWVLRQAQRFPGIEPSTEYGTNDPLLDGEERYEEDWFLGVQLGFSFGPVQSGD